MYIYDIVHNMLDIYFHIGFNIVIIAGVKNSFKLSKQIQDNRHNDVFSKNKLRPILSTYSYFLSTFTYRLFIVYELNIRLKSFSDNNTNIGAYLCLL